MPTVKLHQISDLPNDIDWSELRGKITSWASQVLDALIVANAWTISHPYWTVFILLCICLKPGIILRPLQWTGRAIRYICLLTWRVIAWPFKALNRLILYILGFVRQDVERDSFASYHQPDYYGATGYVPGEPALSQYPSYGATDSDYCGPGSKPAAVVFWTSATGVMFALGREWGPENFFLICAMLLLIMFGALILISQAVTFVPPPETTDEDPEAARSSTR